MCNRTKCYICNFGNAHGYLTMKSNGRYLIGASMLCPEHKRLRRGRKRGRCYS